jgi:hypothetical protein
MLVHLWPPSWLDDNRANRRRPIFWQHGLARSKREVAMRESSQPRCIAADLRSAASRSAKPLEAVRNFDQPMFVRHRCDAAAARQARPDGMKMSNARLTLKPRKQAAPASAA